jgi:signal peptidase II
MRLEPVIRFGAHREVYCLKYKYPWVASIISVIVILDQVTKYLIEQKVRLYDVITIVPGFFNITHVRNRGAAFSLFATASPVFRSLFFTSVSIIAIAVIAYLIRKTAERFQVFAFSCIAAGALGNLIDRIRYGEVVDFIQWYVKSYYWPSFNVADSAITVGVTLLAYDMLFGAGAKLQKTNPS